MSFLRIFSLNVSVIHELYVLTRLSFIYVDIIENLPSNIPLKLEASSKCMKKKQYFFHVVAKSIRYKFYISMNTKLNNVINWLPPTDSLMKNFTKQDKITFCIFIIFLYIDFLLKLIRLIRNSYFCNVPNY